MFQIYNHWPEIKGVNAISRHGSLWIAPSLLVQVLGNGQMYTDKGSKISRQWFLVDRDNFFYSISDYKNTSLYEDHLPSVDEFWEKDSMIEFSIRTNLTSREWQYKTEYALDLAAYRCRTLEAYILGMAYQLEVLDS